MKDTVPVHRKFGYEHMVEMQAIREEMIAEGITDHATLHFGAVDRYIANHKNDPTFAETCARLNAKWRAQQGPLPTMITLTDEELVYLREHFAGANDPLVLGILAKLWEKI